MHQKKYSNSKSVWRELWRDVECAASSNLDRAASVPVLHMMIVQRVRLYRGQQMQCAGSCAQHTPSMILVGAVVLSDQPGLLGWWVGVLR